MTSAGTTSGIIYRAATIDDLETLARLRYAMETERHPDRLQADGEAETYSEMYRVALADGVRSGSHRAWLAEAEGRPVACVLLIIWRMPPDRIQGMRSRGYVSSVYTVPEFRQRGIARQLMTLLLDDARVSGVTRVLLRSSAMGRPLYESLGFAGSPGNALERELDFQ